MTGEHVLVYSAPLSAKTAIPLQITGDYAAGDSVGGVLSVNFPCPIKSGGAGPVGIPLSLIVTDAEKVDADLDVVLFEAPPTITGDEAPFDPTSADLLNIVCQFEVRAADYQDYDANSAAQVAPKASACHITANHNQVWICVIARSVDGWRNADSLNLRIEGVIS
jgi:hypothetical protein